MHPIDFMNDDLVDLPQTHGGDFPAFIDDLFSRYVAHIASVDTGTLLGKFIAKRTGIVQSSCDSLREVLRLALSGDRNGAYDE